MESHELLREVFEQKTPKQISSDLELSTSMIYKWTQPPDERGSGVDNPLDRVDALFQSTGDHRLIQWLCQRAGGFYIPNPKNVPHPDYLIPATNQIVQEFAELLHVVANAAADNQITKAEAAEIRALVDKPAQVGHFQNHLVELMNVLGMRVESRRIPVDHSAARRNRRAARCHD